MELRHLRSFVAVARELHFTRAAARLGIAQPPLSQQIQALERELGVQLFDRSNRRVALTTAGTTLLTRVEPLLAALDETRQMVRNVADEERGQLTVAALPTAAGLLLPPAIIHFRVRYPHIELHVSESGSTTVARLVRSGEADIGILRMPVAAPALMIDPLFAEEEERILIVAPGHPLARRTSVPLVALAGEPFLMTERSRGPALYDGVIEACQAAGFTPHIVCDGAGFQTILRLVAAGLGVALLPRLAVGLNDAPVATVRLEPSLPAGFLAFALPPGKPLTAAGTAFIAEVRTAAANLWQRFG
ncbi:MAG: LysR family transcriptional regulator [Thermomicrobiales bacterium]